MGFERKIIQIWNPSKIEIVWLIVEIKRHHYTTNFVKIFSISYNSANIQDKDMKIQSQIHLN